MINIIVPPKTFYESNITNYSNNEVELIGDQAFKKCENLFSVECNQCKYIDYQAFYSCNNLQTASFPECEYIGISAFAYCNALENIAFPKCKYIDELAFYNCSSLAILDLSLVSSVPRIRESNIFLGTKISTTGSIYVPSSLYNDFCISTYWIYYSSHIYSV